MFDINYINSIIPAEVSNFWLKGDDFDFNEFSLLNLNDYVYVAVLLGRPEMISLEAVDRYIEFSKEAPYYGRSKVKNKYLPHTTAYCFGTLHLLETYRENAINQVLSSVEFDYRNCWQSGSNLPYWPVLWSHHTWRVSHWIGGIPAILLTIARCKNDSIVDELFLNRVLSACDDELLDDRTGLLKVYKSSLLQKIFRQLYKLRHDPEVGDVGGLVHLHWVNYNLERELKAPKNLIDKCLHDMRKRPFVESAPYCLDFDYLNLLRIAVAQTNYRKNEAQERIVVYAQDVLDFFSRPLPEKYGFHKLPGALAVLHEAALITESDKVVGLGIPPVDIINKAYWL